MSKKIYGGLDVTHNVTVNGKRTIQGINEQVFDSNGNLELDTYSRDEVLDIVSMMPISHYGSQNYLPAGVSGDFNGASENQSQRRNKILLENDGTLVLLRSGTNGSVEGLFYSYLANALSVDDMSRTINTSRQYKPGFLVQIELRLVYTILIQIFYSVDILILLTVLMVCSYQLPMVH